LGLKNSPLILKSLLTI